MPLARQEWTWRRSLERLALARLCQAGDLAMAARVCSHTGAVAKTGSWCLFDPEPYVYIYTYIYIHIHSFIHSFIDSFIHTCTYAVCMRIFTS